MEKKLSILFVEDGRAFGADAGMIVANLPLAVDDESAIELDDVGVVVAILVAGAIAADDDVLRHKGTPSIGEERIILARGGKRKRFRRSKE